MSKVLNYIKINDTISTSGQLSVQEFEEIFSDGFEIVINLALSNSTNALKNEDKIVTSLGMNYFHIPVDFENPTLKNLNDFLKLLKAFEGKKIWVHCAKNYRVTAFMYVYHKYVLNTHFDDIDLSMFEQWSPNKSWQDLMKVNYYDLDIEIT